MKYAEIPEEFNQNTHFIKQSDPEEKKDEIFVGIEIHELEIDEETDDEDAF